MQYLSQRMRRKVFTQNEEVMVLQQASLNSMATKRCKYFSQHTSTSFLLFSSLTFLYLCSLYLKYCFEGKSFPKGSAIVPEERVQTLRKELFSLLLTETASPPRSSANMLNRSVSRGIRSLSFPYLRALILIDARNGVVEQTKRHSYIASLLQIPHVLVCINKMDLVNYDNDRYEEIKEQSEADCHCDGKI